MARSEGEDEDEDEDLLAVYTSVTGTIATVTGSKTDESKKVTKAYTGNPSLNVSTASQVSWKKPKSSSIPVLMAVDVGFGGGRVPKHV